MNRFGVILTHNRPELLRQTVAAIGPQVDMVLVIDNASDPPVPLVQFDQLDPDGDRLGLGEAGQARIAVLRVPDQPPNLYRFWNIGIRHAFEIGAARLGGAIPTGEHVYVAMLCDDAPPPEGWFDAVLDAMKTTGAVVGCSHPDGGGGPPTVKTQPDGDIRRRMPGWAWVLDACHGPHADEQFEWWWGDTDFDMSARAAGGVVMIGTHPVPNVHPNEFSMRPEQMEQIGRDAERYATKHGSRPW